MLCVKCSIISHVSRQFVTSLSRWLTPSIRQAQAPQGAQLPQGMGTMGTMATMAPTRQADPPGGPVVLVSLVTGRCGGNHFWLSGGRLKKNMFLLKQNLCDSKRAGKVDMLDLDIWIVISGIICS